MTLEAYMSLSSLMFVLSLLRNMGIGETVKVIDVVEGNVILLT